MLEAEIGQVSGGVSSCHNLGGACIIGSKKAFFDKRKGDSARKASRIRSRRHQFYVRGPQSLLQRKGVVIAKRERSLMNVEECAFCSLLSVLTTLCWGSADRLKMEE